MLYRAIVINNYPLQLHLYHLQLFISDILTAQGYQSFRNALAQNLIEDFLCDIVVTESSAPVRADRRCVRRFFCKPQSAESFVRNVIIDLFFQPRFRLDSIQISYDEHAEDDLRIYRRSAVIRAI